jgi:hypothetical protein
MTALAKTAAIVNDRPILSSERMLHRDLTESIQLENKITGRGSQRVCRQDEVIGGKPPVVK